MATFLSDRNPKSLAFIAGSGFLFLYWLFGFDGITFSDDVYYLLAGKKFWEGTMEASAYHFSTRWGAYIPAGLIGFLLGFDPHLMSLISWVGFIGTLWLLIKILPASTNPWILLIWTFSQVYLLHFLTKVYPDALLVFWTVLIPFAAAHRHSRPFPGALGMVAGFFFGFLTKETIVFLALLPLLLFAWDWKKGNANLTFYLSLLGLGFGFAVLYLGYFWIKFGSPFYRFESIQDGHYVSEFTYADKSAWIMFKRLTILPIVTFIERSYWIWLVFAIPGLVKVCKKPSSPGIEFGLSLVSLLVLFWFMSTNFRFYNPLYLNPRHLIILVPIMAFLIALGWDEWKDNPSLKKVMAGLIVLGIGISLIQQDWKMAGFQFAFLPLLLLRRIPFRNLGFAMILLLPALASLFYQHRIKGYSSFIQSLTQEIKNTEYQSIIICNNFVHFSKEVLLPDNPAAQNLLFPIEKLDSLQRLQVKEIRVLLYDYYRHAYPKEQTDVDALEHWLQGQTLISEEREGLVWVRRYALKNDR